MISHSQKVTGLKDFFFFSSSGDRLPVCYGSSHSVQGKEFLRQARQFRNVSTGEAVTPSAVVEEVLPSEVKQEHDVIFN